MIRTTKSEKGGDNGTS